MEETNFYNKHDLYVSEFNMVKDDESLFYKTNIYNEYSNINQNINEENVTEKYHNILKIIIQYAGVKTYYCISNISFVILEDIKRRKIDIISDENCRRIIILFAKMRLLTASFLSHDIPIDNLGFILNIYEYTIINKMKYNDPFLDKFSPIEFDERNYNNDRYYINNLFGQVSCSLDTKVLCNDITKHYEIEWRKYDRKIKRYENIKTLFFFICQFILTYSLHIFTTFDEITKMYPNFIPLYSKLSFFIHWCKIISLIIGNGLIIKNFIPRLMRQFYNLY